MWSWFAEMVSAQYFDADGDEDLQINYQAGENNVP